MQSTSDLELAGRSVLGIFTDSSAPCADVWKTSFTWPFRINASNGNDPVLDHLNMKSAKLEIQLANVWIVYFAARAY